MKKHFWLKLTTLALASFGALSAQASDVTVVVKESNGTVIQGASVKYQHYSGGVMSVGSTDVNGTIVKTGVSSGGNRFTVIYNNSSFTTPALAVVNGDTTIIIYTTAVTLNNYSSNGSLLAGVSSRYTWSGSTTNPIGNNVTGTGTKEMFPGTYSMTSSYKATDFTRSETITGDGFTSGSATTLSTYTSKLTLRAYTNGNAGVPGVPFRYSAGGSVSNQSGTTDANGLRDIELFPGSYTFYGGYVNGTMQTWSISIGGDGYTANTAQTENVVLSRVIFHNAGAVKYSSSGIRTITGTSFYMFPGTYTLRFYQPGSSSVFYTKSVNISGANFEQVASIILVKDHTGAFMPISSARGGYAAPTAWNISTASIASDQGDGIYIHLSNYNSGSDLRTYEVKKNNTLSTTTQDVTVNNLYNFQTSLFTLNLKDCNGNGVAHGSARYGYNQSPTATGVPATSYFWPGGATDANGETSMEAFPGTFGLEMAINQSREVKADYVYTGSNDATWTTTKVTFNYPGVIAYGGTGVSAYFTNNSEMLPGTVNFSFRVNGENIVPVTIPASTQGNCANFEKTVVIGRLLNSSNAPLAGGSMNFYLGGWYSATGPTQANGNAVALLNGNQTTATTAMSYAGSSQQQNFVALAPVNNVIVYKTSLITMTLVDANNNPIEADAGSVQYYAGGWNAFGGGNTTNGVASMELFASSSYSYVMKLNGSRVQKSFWNTATTPTIDFHASNVTLQLNNGCVEGGIAYYYTNGWYSMGTTDGSGLSDAVNFLTGSAVTFKMTKSPYSAQQNSVPITSGFQTVVFNSTNTGSCPIALRLAAPLTHFSFSPNPVSTDLNIEVAADNSVVSILSMDGKVVYNQSFNTGRFTINASNFAQGIYMLKVNNGKDVETYKFVKQ